MSDLLKNKNVLVMGLRNKWSIAWGIAEAAKREGANIIITYLGEREKENAENLAKSIGCTSIFNCDISSDEDIEKLFSDLKNTVGNIHGLVHCIANAKAEDLQNDFIYTSRSGFSHAMDISVYSLIALTRKAREIMVDGGSIITLSYMGAEKVFPNYNVMAIAKAALECTVKYLASDIGSSNIRINAISAGPIKTLSAKGVKNFGDFLKSYEEKSPLKRGITLSDLGNAALFLLSDLSNSITGEIMHVDCGYNIMGV